jgi:diadenosine tetraphosphate (Ap4A) HIT family hydrolase
MSDPSDAPPCIFCAIASGEAQAEIIDSDQHTVSMMDINPATRGHALVIPRKHADDPLKLPWIPRGADMDEVSSIAATIREGQ